MKAHCKNHPFFDEENNQSFTKINKKRRPTEVRSKKKAGHREPEKQFRCCNCGAIVSTDRELAGVNNRNHCPNCLWSKHVDEFKAGDRRSACGARMCPIGLTVKKVHKKYTVNGQGELMLIHHCSSCGKISINRIASDDSSGALISLYHAAEDISDEFIGKLAEQNIHLLSAGDLTTVFSQLFGWQAILKEFEGENQPKLSEEMLLQEDTLEE